MRIAILADPLSNQTAGVHVYTRELIAALHKNSKHQYILVSNSYHSEYADFEQVIVPRLSWLPAFQTFRLFFLIPFILWRKNIDAVFEPAHFGPFNLPKRIKRITMIHDLTPIKFPEFHRWHSQLLQRLFLPLVLKKSDLLLTNSDSTSSDLVDYQPLTKNKYKRIYLGKDETIYRKTDPKILKIYKIDAPYFLFVGTIEPRKNLIVLLKAYQLFREKTGKNYQLVIAGQKGWKYTNFFNFLKTFKYKNELIITGFVPHSHLPALYSAADLFIYPSLYEGFGFPILEAMNCGTACLVSNISSMPEVGGNAALTFNPNSPNDLCNKMIQLLTNKKLQADLEKKSVQNAQKFSWKNYANEFETALTTLQNQSIY